MIVLTSVMIVVNSYHTDEYLGTDDSSLGNKPFRATWILVLISGVFCTLGKYRTICVLFE